MADTLFEASEIKEMVRVRYGSSAVGTVADCCASAASSCCGTTDALAAAGFTDIRVRVKPESRDLVASWAPGRAIENYVASAIVEARKPRSGDATASCAPGCCS